MQSGVNGIYVRIYVRVRDIVKISRVSEKKERKRKEKKEKKERNRYRADKSLDRIVIYNFLLRENAGLDDIERKETRCRER